MSYRQVTGTTDQYTSFSLLEAFSSKIPSDCTYIFVWKPDGVDAHGLINTYKAAFGAISAINPYSDNKIYVSFNGFSNTVSDYFFGDSRDGWRIDVLRMTAGSGSRKFRHSWFLYSTGEWTHEDSAGNVGVSTQSPGDMNFANHWRFDSGNYLKGDGAAVGVASWLMTDGECVGLENGIWAWQAKGIEHIAAYGQTERDDPLPQLGSDSGVVVFRSNTGAELWVPGYDGTATGPNPPQPWSYSTDQPGTNGHSAFGQTMSFFNSGDDADNYTLGVEGSAYVAGSITAVWFYPPLETSINYHWRVYQGHVGESSSLLASGSIDSGSYDNSIGWQRFPITPVDVTGMNFIVALHVQDGSGYNYVYWNNPGSENLDDGVIVTNQGGCYKDSDAHPNQNSDLYYGVDYEFTPAGGGTPYRASQFLPFFT